jgi:hypothetical protein
MDPVAYFKDLSKELRAVQNRVRHLIGDVHWPSDGAWKESVLRTVLRRYFPPSFTVGSGFILTDAGVSSQMDILVCDDSAPILFRDGDFLISTAACVRAAVEVKTHLSAQKLNEALEKLNELSVLISQKHGQPFLGLFCYDSTDIEPDAILSALQSSNGEPLVYEIRALCFGDSQFYRFWEFNPSSTSRQRYDSWHAYELPEIAPGYFIHNLVEFVFPDAVGRTEALWYPVDGKERHIVGSMKRSPAQ